MHEHCLVCCIHFDLFQKSSAKVEVQEAKRHKKADSGLPPGKAVAPVAKGTVKEADQKKLQTKLEQRHRSMSVSSDGKEKKAEGHKSSGQQHSSKGDSEAVSKVSERTGDKGKGTGSGNHAEDTAPAVKPLKHKHRKSEEIIIDPSVTDLFKPDGVIPTEHVKKEGETAESAVKETKDLACGGVKEDVHDGKNTVRGMAHGTGMSVEGKSGVGGMLQRRGLSVEGAKNWGDAGPDKNLDHAHQVSQPIKQPVVPQLIKQAVSSMEQKVVAEGKQLSQTATSSSSKETPQQFVSVSLKTEKGQAKVLHTKQMQQHDQSLEKDGQKPAHSQQGKELKSSHFQEEAKSFEVQQIDEQKSSLSQHKEEPKMSQQKEERKSLFEVLAKAEVTEGLVKESKQHKKEERKESTEKTHPKPHKEKRCSKDGK